MPPMIGQISLFPYNFAPAGWMFCEGQLLPIPQNEVLFQLLGTTYGGDGEETFGLPDLTAAAPPNLHYCISLFGEFGTSTYTYNAIIGETMVAIPSLVARNLLQAAGQSMLNNMYLLLSAYMGTRFGGDATHFSLPDLRSKAPSKCQYLIAVQGDPPNNRARVALFWVRYFFCHINRQLIRCWLAMARNFRYRRIRRSTI